MDTYIKTVPGKGRGVFAERAFEKDEVIEKTPVNILNKEDTAVIVRTMLERYVFEWGEHRDEAAIALGHGSLYNHSYQNNASYIRHSEEIWFVALREIEQGEEITVNYNGGQLNQLASVGFEVK